MNKLVKTVFCATMILGMSACSPKKVEQPKNEPVEEKTTEEANNSIVGKWEVSYVTAKGNKYSLEDLKKIFSEEQYNQILLGFEFTDKNVSMTVNGNPSGTTGYQLKEDGSYQLETGKFSFKMVDGELQLVQNDSTIHFARVN